MGQIPYGYRIENGAAVIVPEEAAQIRLIFQNYIAGMSLQSAARAAGHPMAHSTVRRMLQRKCYLGDAFYPAILDKETYARANAEWQHRANAMQRMGRTRRKPVFPQTSFRVFQHDSAITHAGCIPNFSVETCRSTIPVVGTIVACQVILPAVKYELAFFNTVAITTDEHPQEWLW